MTIPIASLVTTRRSGPERLDGDPIIIFVRLLVRVLETASTLERWSNFTLSTRSVRVEYMKDRGASN